MSDYPEHGRMKAIKDEADVIAAFMEWLLHEQGYSLHTYTEHGDCLTHPANGTSIQKWLADYFDIDLDRIEEEKRQMLDGLRAATPTKGGTTTARVVGP